MNSLDELRRYELNDRTFIIIIDGTRTQIVVTDQEIEDNKPNSVAWIVTQKYIDTVRDGTARGEKLRKEFLASKLWKKITF